MTAVYRQTYPRTHDRCHFWAWPDLVGRRWRCQLVTTNHFNALERALETAGQLGYDDVFAAEALISAMAGWDEAELAEYRQAVLSELAARGNRPLEGFLAVEVVALCVVTPTA